MMVNFKNLTFIFIVLLAGCFGGEDQVDFKGITQSNNAQTPSPSPGTEPTNSESTIKALQVDGNRIVISGENLDRVENLELFSNEFENESTSNLSVAPRKLKIISKTASKIVAAGKEKTIDLFFDGRYDLIKKDLKIEKLVAFPFVVLRKEVSDFDTTKVNENIELETKLISTQGNDKDVVIYSAALDEWTTGKMTGQLEFLGSWDPLGNSGVTASNSEVTIEPTGTNSFLPISGQYFVIKSNCYVLVDEQTTPVAFESPDKNCPFGPLTSQENIIQGRLSYRIGDWIVYSENRWHYINNHGEVESFNNRVGAIESCPNPKCPNTYDYNWKMINKKGSKLGDIADIPRPTENNDNHVIKVVDGKLTLAKDEKGITELNSENVLNQSLVDEDFSSGLSLSKFSGVRDVLNSYVDKVPSSGTAEIAGDLDFADSSISGVNEIQTTSGNFVLSEMRSLVDGIDLPSKLNSISTAELDSTKKYYLSSNIEGVLTWKELTTENLLEGATNFYFSEAATQQAVSEEELENLSGDIQSSDTIKKAFQRLGAKKESYLARSGIPIFSDKSVTLNKLQKPVNNEGEFVNGLLYFNAESGVWSYVNVSGFNLLGKFDPTSDESINAVTSSTPNAGDFYVLKSSGTVAGIIGLDPYQFNEGDWIVWDGNGWRKIDYSGKVISIHSKKDIVQAGPGQYSWEQVVISPYALKNPSLSAPIPNSEDPTESHLLDISDVSGTVNSSDAGCCLLRWNGASWDVSIDASGNSVVGGSQISGLENKHFASGLSLSKVNGLNDKLTSALTKATPEALTGPITFSGTGSTFININNISSGSKQIGLSELGTKLEELYNALANDKQPSIIPNGGAEFIAGDLTYKTRDSDAVVESLDPSAGKYITDKRVMDTRLQDSDVDGVDGQGAPITSSTNPTSSTTLGEGLDILIHKVNNRFAGSAPIEGETLKDESILPIHFSTDGASPGDYLYFDGANWVFQQHSSSLNFLATISDGESPTSSPSEGDYYIADGLVNNFNGTITLNTGDWVMFIQGAWTKLTNVSQITSFSLGSEAQTGSGLFLPSLGDYHINQIQMDGSLLTDLSDVELVGVLESGKVLKLDYNGGDVKWVVGDDLSGASEIDGADILGKVSFTRDYYQPESAPASSSDPDNRLGVEKLYTTNDPYLKKVASEAQLLDSSSLVADFKNNAISGVDQVNGFKLEDQKSAYDNFSTAAANFELSANVMGKASSSPVATKFFVSTGINDRAFRLLTLDDVSLEGSTKEFYNPENVFNTTLTGYNTSSTDQSAVVESDTPLTALRKLENQVDNSGGSINIKLHEDHVSADAAGGVYKSKYALDASDNNDVFVSSYSIFSLPSPETISSGYKVTIKSENGPVFIYPSYSASYVSGPPMIEAKHKQLILTEKDAFVRITFEDGDWWVTDSDKISYSILKDDRPESCPSGMAAVAGSYLLETNGFCIDVDFEFATARDLNSTVNSVNYTYDKFTTAVTTAERVQSFHEDCENIRDYVGSGYSGITSMGQLLTVFQNAATYNSSGFFGTLREYDGNDPHKGHFYGISSLVELGDLDYLYLRRHRYYLYANAAYPESQGYYGNYGFREITSLNVDPNSIKRKAILDYADCHDSSINKTGPFNLSYTLTDNETNGALGTEFSSISKKHYSTPLKRCGINPFFWFSGNFDSEIESVSFDFFNDAKNIDLFSGSGDWAASEKKVLYLDSDFENNNQKLSVGSVNDNWFSIYKGLSMESARALRCTYEPVQFRCELPSSLLPEYDISGCQTTSGNKLTKEECNVQCASGYSLIPGFSIEKNCNPENGSVNGVFSFGNCVDEALLNSPKTISSCQSSLVEKSGIYNVDLLSDGDAISDNVKVFCEVDQIGNKYINILKTIGIAKNDNQLDEISSLFFRSNNDSSIKVRYTKNKKDEAGILIQNLGENAPNITARNYGFEFGQWAQQFDEIKLDYIMQGASDYSISDPSSECNGNNSIYLNGPGSLGTHSYNPSREPVGYSVIQGQNYRYNKAPIYIKGYENNEVTIDNLFSWSGSGIDGMLVADCARADRIPLINEKPTPSTFITKLLIRDKDPVRCKIPTTSNGLAFSCIGGNEDDLYHPSQCSVSCQDSSKVIFPQELKIECNPDPSVSENFFEFKGWCSDPAQSLCLNDELNETFSGTKEELAADSSSEIFVHGNYLNIPIDWDIQNVNGENKLGCERTILNTTSNKYKRCALRPSSTFKPPFTLEYDYEIAGSYNNQSTQNYMTGITIYKNDDSLVRQSTYGYITNGNLLGRINIRAYDNPLVSGPPQPENTAILMFGIFRTPFGSYINFPSNNIHLKLDIGLDRKVTLTVSDNDGVVPDEVRSGYFEPEDDLFLKEMTAEFSIGGFDYRNLPENQRVDYMDNVKVTCPSINEIFGVYNRPDDYSGYDVSSCPNQSRLSDCSISCTSGYVEDDLNPIQVLADKSTGKFIFRGCYPSPANTLAQKVERLINDRNIVHVSANDYALNTTIDQANSRANKYNQTHSFLTYNTHPDGTSPSPNYELPIVGEAGAHFFDFDYRSRHLINEDFNLLNRRKKFTALTVYYSRAGSSATYRPMFSAPAFGNIGNMAGGVRIETMIISDELLNPSGTYGHEIVNPGNDRAPHVYAVTVNGEEKNIYDKITGFMDGKLSSTTNGPYDFSVFLDNDGLTIGGQRLASQSVGQISSMYFLGGVGEVLLFDEILSEEQIRAISDYFLIQYGQKASCSLPPYTTGYDVSSCDTSFGSIVEEDCKVTCASGYSDLDGYFSYDNDDTNSVIEGKAYCDPNTGLFSLKGCVSTSALNDEVAKEIISNHAILHMDPESLPLTDGEEVTSWLSENNKRGDSHEFTIEFDEGNSYGFTPPKFKIDGNLKFVQFEKDGYLKNTDFRSVTKPSLESPNPSSEVTRIFVIQPNLKNDNTSYNDSPAYIWHDQTSGYDAFRRTNNTNYTSWQTHFWSRLAWNYRIDFGTELLESLTGGANSNADFSIYTSSLVSNTDFVEIGFKNSISSLNEAFIYTYGSIDTGKALYFGTNGTGASIGNYKTNTTSRHLLYNGKLSDIVIFDSILSDEYQAIVYAYLMKKNEIALSERCMISPSFIEADQALEPLFPEPDDKYFSEQIKVTCNPYYPLIPQVRCESDGYFRVENCQ